MILAAWYENTYVVLTVTTVAGLISTGIIWIIGQLNRLLAKQTVEDAKGDKDRNIINQPLVVKGDIRMATYEELQVVHTEVKELRQEVEKGNSHIEQEATRRSEKIYFRIEGVERQISKDKIEILKDAAAHAERIQERISESTREMTQHIGELRGEVKHLSKES